jgi:hypothetical protein
VFRDRHHQQQQGGHQNQKTAQRPGQLVAIRRPSPIPQVANGSHVRPHIIATGTPACSNDRSSVTHSA